jgi:hypothetical protein
MIVNTGTQAFPEIKESCRKFAEQVTGWQVRDTNIKKMKVRTFSWRIRRLVESNICVGEYLDFNLSNLPNEQVIAIFESNEYLVVTPNKSDLKGTVYFFPQKEVVAVEKE